MLLFMIAFCVGLVLGWYVGYPLVEKGYRLRVPWERVYKLEDIQKNT